MKVTLPLLALCFALTACGGGSSGGNPIVDPGDNNLVTPEPVPQPEPEPTPEPEPFPEPEPEPDAAEKFEQALAVALELEAATEPKAMLPLNQLKPVAKTAASLELIEGESLEAYVKNGVMLESAKSFYHAFQFASDAGVDFSPAPPSSSPPAPQRYSETNTHVAGVDEADFAKYDGKHWFVISSPHYDVEGAPGIQILATDPEAPSVAIVGGINLSTDNWPAPESIYLNVEGERASALIAIRQEWGNVFPVPSDYPAVEFSPMPPIDGYQFPFIENSKLHLQFFNVEDPAQPTLSKVLTLDGSLMDSRKIGKKLYVLTRFDPWFHSLEYAQGDSEVLAQNKELLESVRLSELMPQYYVGDASKPLSMSCHVPNDLQTDHGFNTLIHITTIDLDAQSIVDSQCVGADFQTISMSHTSLYLTANYGNYDNNATLIHKFSLGDEAINYAATGTVQGRLDWLSDPVFRLHEHDGHLRVVTTERLVQPVHRLTILEQNGNLLKPVAQLPNENFPAAIGKPGEGIYAVRFTEDRAYIVTFLNIDPLYSIDLSDQLVPKIIGALEIPGVSNYMHPLNKDYIFTLGTEDGLKFELVKITNGDPEVVAKKTFAHGSFSEALTDLRAISVLPMGNGEVRVAFPFGWYDYEYRLGLQQLTLKGLDGNSPQLIDEGALEGSADHRYRGIKRSVIHNDAVFFTADNGFWAAPWHAPELADDVIPGVPFECAENMAPGLEIMVKLPTVSTDNACDAMVTASDDHGYFETLHVLRNSGTHQCVFGGAVGREGDYDVNISLDGYKPQILNSLRVRENRCQVDTARRLIRLDTN